MLLTALILLVAMTVSVLIEIFLFWGGCALADIEPPSTYVSLAIIFPLLIGRGVLAFFLTRLFPSETVLPDNLQISSLLAEYFSAVYWIRFGILTVITWMLLAGGFAVFGPRRIGRGMYAAGAFLFLELLVGTVLFGLLLVFLAVQQIWTGPSNTKSAASSVLVAPVTHRT